MSGSHPASYKFLGENYEENKDHRRHRLAARVFDHRRLILAFFVRLRRREISRFSCGSGFDHMEHRETAECKTRLPREIYSQKMSPGLSLFYFAARGKPAGQSESRLSLCNFSFWAGRRNE